MKRTLRRLLLASALGAVAVSLSGCIGLTVAGIAASVVGNAIGGGGQTASLGPSPSEQIYDGLSQIDDQVSSSCTAKLASLESAGAQALAEAEPDGRPNAWEEPDWAFGADAAPAAAQPGEDAAPVATPVATAERIEGRRCAVRLSCLPGMAQPTRMMVCESPQEAAGLGEPAPSAADRAGARSTAVSAPAAPAR